MWKCPLDSSQMFSRGVVSLRFSFPEEMEEKNGLQWVFHCAGRVFLFFFQRTKNTHTQKRNIWWSSAFFFSFSGLFFTSSVLVYSSLSIRRERAVSMKRKESNRASKGKNIIFIVVVAIKRATERERERENRLHLPQKTRKRAREGKGAELSKQVDASAEIIWSDGQLFQKRGRARSFSSSTLEEERQTAVATPSFCCCCCQDVLVRNAK